MLSASRNYCLLLLLVLSQIMALPLIAAPLSPDELPLSLTHAQKQWLKQHDIITLGVASNWPPISYLDARGKHQGYSAVMFEILNKRLGGRLTRLTGSWPELYQQTQQGKLDLLLGITPHNSRQHLHFTRPYLTLPEVIVGKRTNRIEITEAELAGKRIAMEQDFLNADYFRKQFPNAEILEFTDTYDALLAVMQDQADIYIGNQAVANHIITREHIDSLKIYGKSVRKVSPLAVGVLEQHSELFEIIQAALDSITSQELKQLADELTKHEDLKPLGGSLLLTPAERSWLKRHPKIRLASDPTWEPMEYIDQEGNYSGIASDFIALVEKKLNIQFVRSPQRPWSELMEQVQQRQLDLFSMAADTPYRRQFVQFTKPYISNTMVIVAHNSVGFIPSIEALSGKKVAVGEGHIVDELLRATNPEIQLLPVEDVESGLNAVARGEAFAYIGNIATATYLIHQKGLHNLRVSGELPYRYELAMGVRSDWPELVNILNKALDSITAQEKAEIFAHWLHPEAKQDIPWHIISGVILVLTILIALVLYWNILLNRKVHQRTKQLEHQALHDELTELPNRTALKIYLAQQIARAKRSQSQQFSVLFIDLDDFKKVNDTIGHSMGDKLLQAVASRLKASLRETDYISRFAGDEFVVVSQSVNSDACIETLCTHLLQAMQPTYNIGSKTFKLSMTIGIACYPNDGEDHEELLRNADTAMYAGKKQGRDGFNFFSSEMNLQMKRRMQLEEQLFQSLESSEIFLAYQPIIDLQTGAPVKFEVLARWDNTTLGSIPPDEFIPLAESNGYIALLGEYVLQESLKACRRLRDTFQIDYCLTVNVSPRQLTDPHFSEMVTNQLKLNNLPAESLTLEVTEGVLLAKNKLAEKTLLQLSEQGIKLAMDDFGTGYSSLSYVRNYPFDILKIDKEFVQDIHENDGNIELINTVLAMARSLQIEVIAEGVETHYQAERLTAMGCHYGQGYHYSRPVTEEVLVAWLNQLVNGDGTL